MKQWKRILSFVLAVSLVASMGIVLPEVQADSSPVFPTETTWDFAGADGWTLGSGYAVSDGKLVWQTVGSQNNGTSAFPDNTAAAAWTNYTLSADITATYNNSANQNQHAMAGLNFYVSDSDNIQIRVRPTTVANKFTLYVRENGAALDSKDVVVGTDSSVNKETRSFNLKADMHYDGKLTVYINDTEVWTGTVSTPGGKPGVTAWASAGSATTADTVTFDNVKVTPLAAPVITPEADYNGTLLGWSDGSADLGEDWTVTGTYTAENGVLKATTADNFSAKVGSAVQHGYIEADVTLPAKSDFTATANKSLGYLTATVGSNQVYTLRLFWQQTKNSTTLHDGTLYADLFINDSAANMTAQYGGAAQGTRVSFKLADANWGKTYTMRLARIGNFVNASLVDTETGSTLKSWQYALNPAYSIVTGPVTFAFAADTKDTGCTVTFDNVVAASVDAYAVSAGELEMTVDSLKEIAAGRDDSTIDSFYRTAYAPGEIVTVTLKSADAWKLDSLGYTTASNPTGAKLVATDDDKVYTFIMPDEAVTLVGESAAGEITEPAYELLYDMAATPDANSTTGWRANATTVADKGVCVKPAADTNGLTNYYNTGVVSGWIKADITLPTITEAQLQTNAANTGDIWYGLRMCRGDGANIESSKYIDAAIWYQRNTGTTEATPKIGKSYLRIRFSGTGYDTANLLEISLPNTLWTTGATVSMEMRKVGNYILVKVSCDTIPEANQIACCTVNFDTFAGGKDGTWKFGLKADNPLLYTDWTKTEQVAAEAYFNNVEIGNILRTVSVNVDSTAAEYVSLPEVNEFKDAALARDAYEVGEVLELTVADDADVSCLHYTTDKDTSPVAIATPEAFEVPDAQTATIAYGKQQIPADEPIYTNDGTQDLTAEDWGTLVSKTENGITLVTNMDSKNANKTVFYSTAMEDGWIKADITLPTITVEQMVDNNGASGNIPTSDTANLFYGFIMQDAANSGNMIQAAIFYQRNAGTTAAAQYSKLRVRCTGAGYNATNIAEIKLPNEIWDSSKTLTLMLRKVGNYVEAILIAEGVEYVAKATAKTDTVLGSADTTWKLGLYTNVGMLFTDKTKAAKLDRTAYFTNIEVGKINTRVTIDVDSASADKVSLPEVNEVGTTTALARTAYQIGEVLKLTVADGVSLKYTTADNTEGTVITDTEAFEVPGEAAITLTTGEGGGSTEPEDLISATYNGGEYDATKWTATGSNAYVSEPFANGYIEAEFAISGTISNAANMFVRSPKTAGGALFGQEEEIMLRWTVTADNSQPGYTHKATSTLVIRDYATPGYQLAGANAIHGKAKTVYLNIQEGTPAILKVKMEVVGNLLRIYVNGELHQEATFDPQYPIASQAGFFGYYGLSDNAKVTKATVQEYKTYTVTTPDSMTADETAHLVNPNSAGASFGRTQYVEGELVTIMVNNTTGLDLTTLRYTTATNTEGTALTATAVPGIYTFQMPAEAATVVCDDAVLTEPSEVIATVDGASNLDADLWTVTGAYTADGTIRTTANNFNAALDGTYQHFSIEADITLPAKSADLPTDSNVTLANMIATVGSNQHYTTRFFWQGKANTFYFDLFLNDANSAYSPSIYGGAADGGRIGVALDDSHWGKTYTVKLSRIGNCLAYSVVETGTDNVIVDAVYNLNPAYTITTGAVSITFGADGSKGEVAFDNLTVTSYNPKTVDKGELAVTLDEAREHCGGKDGSGIEAFDRTHYAAGELVTVTVSDPSGLDLETLRFATASNPAGTTLTATADPLVFTFVMPNENVTLLCDAGSGLPIVPKPEGQILKQNFDAVANGTTADKIFKDMDVREGASNAKAQDGALKLSNRFSMQTPEQYLHGHLQADITLENPLDAVANATETVTKYGGNLSAKWGGFNSSNNEMRTRFMITRTPGAEEEYKVFLQLIVYARVGDNNYGSGPVIQQVELTDFAWGNTYNVKLSVIGNWVTVHLDGARVMAYSVPADSNIASYEGHFGVAHIGGGFAIAVDNLEIQSYKAYEVSFDSAMDGILQTDIYPDAKSGKTASRTHYLENEFVKLYVSAPAGYGIDDATIKYTGQTCGEVAITAKDSAILYGFRMPAEDVTVSASLTEAETQTDPINDTFDIESLMVDRGWGKEFKILEGKARAYGYTDSYLTGVAGADNWQSYTASAKINVLNTTGSSTAVASLCVKTGSAAAGYEFGMTFNAGATTGNLRLYDRTNGEMLYTGEKELETGVEYTLTLVVTGNRITGYLNGAWRFTVTVEDCTGGVGIRAQGVNVIYDDVKVTDIVAK